MNCPLPEVFFGGARGGGKCIPLDEFVLTPFGYREMREIEPGSQVCNPNGTISRVIACHRPGDTKVWRITFSDGTSAICDDGHIWLGHFVGHRIKRGGLRLWTFADIRSKYERDKDPKFLVPLCEPVMFTRPHTTKHGNQLPLDPYLLGVLLGDGNLTGSSVRYATEDKQIDEHMAMFGVVRIDDGPNRRLIDAPAVLNGFRSLDLWGKYAHEKAVPDAYLWAGKDVRRACLQGLMDTDGTVDSRGQCYFTSTSRQLAEDVTWIARTLGYKAKIWTKEITHKDAHNVYIQGPSRENLFRLERKQERAAIESQNGTHAKSIENIEDAGVSEVGCFQVDDPNGLFLLRDCTVTHNTDAVLGKWARCVLDYGSLFNAVMFRRTMTSADDAIERGRQLYPQLGGKYNDNYKTFFFGRGRIRIRYLDNVKDADHYQGQNLTHAWVEEAGQYAQPDPIDRLQGAIRSPHGVPTQLTITANPGGAGQSWLRERYHLHPLPKRPAIHERELEDGSKIKVAVIPSRIGDNRILLRKDPGYPDRLKLVGGAKLVKAWLDGDWSAVEGAFFDEFSESVHVLDPFEIPADWTRIVSFDWGSARPFSVGWWSVAREDYGVVPQGALIRYREWYGASKPNVGLKLPAGEVADGIRERTREKVHQYVADPAIFTRDGGPSIAERMKLPWIPADNTRIARHGHVGGWDQVRARLRDRMLFVFSTCTDFLRTFPVLQHDPIRSEDLDSDSEDHIADETRYCCMLRIYRGKVRKIRRDEELTDRLEPRIPPKRKRHERARRYS